MGYTHYWNQTRDFTDDEWGTICARAENVIDEYEDILCYEEDEPKRKPEVSKTCVRFNGKGEDGHETFYLPRKQEPRSPWHTSPEEEGTFHFCKTAYKPYDAAVVAVLIEVRDVAPGAITLSSDGDPGVFNEDYDEED
jgi:hypothetical protein